MSDTIKADAPRPSARRAWLLLAASFITFTVSGACMQSYTVFLVAFIEEFRWSRGESSLAYSVSQFITGMTSPLVGVLVDRLGPARLVLTGGVVLALGLFASSFVHALWQLVILYGVLMTLGANCLGLVVFVPLNQHGFSWIQTGYSGPSQGLVTWTGHMILPWITLAAVQASVYTRLTRGQLRVSQFELRAGIGAIQTGRFAQRRDRFMRLP